VARMLSETFGREPCTTLRAWTMMSPANGDGRQIYYVNQKAVRRRDHSTCSAIYCYCHSTCSAIYCYCHSTCSAIYCYCHSTCSAIYCHCHSTLLCNLLPLPQYLALHSTATATVPCSAI
jgi:hypothetical protein